MRIPFILLILCLIVVYGACPMYGAEIGDVAKEKKGITDFVGVILGFLKDMCPEVEKLSYDLDKFGWIAFHPLQTLRNIICYILQLGLRNHTSERFQRISQLRDEILTGLAGLNTMLKN